MTGGSGARDGLEGAAPVDGADGAAGLADLARLARRAEAPAVAAEADALARRLSEGRFFVTFAGQFKRGKSALINALVGEPVLPSGVVPVTAVVTVVRYGERGARVLLAAGWTPIDPGDLASFVAEERNPGNVRAVRAVEVFRPHPLLASGMCLVDTPGLGSTSAANTAATRDFLPQIDAVIAVLGADPPITGDELAVLAELAARRAPLLLVLNKADRLPDGDRQAAVEFTRRVLAERLGPAAGGVPTVYQVSAAERLQGEGPPRDWLALLHALADLAAGADTGLVHVAAERGKALLAGRLEHDLSERRMALSRPAVESAARLERLRRAIAAAEITAADLPPLLAAEESRFRLRLSEDRRQFLAGADGPAQTGIAAILRCGEDADSGEAGAGRRASRVAAAVRHLARQRIDDWRAALTPQAERLYGTLAARYLELANGLLSRIGELPEAAAHPAPIAAQAGFRVGARFVFHDMMTLAEPRGDRLLRRLLPRLAQRRLARHAARYLRRLMTGNSSRAVNDLQERMLASRRLLESELLCRLREITAAAAQALDRAVAVNAAGALRVRDECEKLDGLAAELAAWRRSTARDPQLGTSSIACGRSPGRGGR